MSTQTVASVATNDIRDIHPPVPLPDLWSWLGWVLAVLALAGAAGALWRLWRGRRARILAQPPEPPHVRARRRLGAALALLPDARAFCFAVSDALRCYLEERFGLHAPERTTEEFLSELQHSDRLTAAQKQTLGDFLQRCDLVKFARHRPAEPELRELYAVALQLIAETQPIEAPAPAGHEPGPVVAPPAGGSQTLAAAQPH